jgi:hypothetical protein
VIAEPNGTAVAVDCRVSHIEDGQMEAASRGWRTRSCKLWAYFSLESRSKSSRTAWINVFLRGSCPLGEAASTDSR